MAALSSIERTVEPSLSMSRSRKAVKSVNIYPAIRRPFLQLSAHIIRRTG